MYRTSKNIVSALATCFIILCGANPHIVSGSEIDQSVDHTDYPLKEAQAVLIETIVLTERGLQNPSLITDTVSNKLRQAGFTIISSPDQPHDVIVRIKCEEQQSWAGLSKTRSTSPGPISRLWKGPACHLSYRYQDHAPNWKWEVRTAFEDARTAAHAAGSSEPGSFAMNALNNQLQHDHFPLYLMAEWGQTERMVQLLQNGAHDAQTQKVLLQLLGTLPSHKAFEALCEALSDPRLTSDALQALGHHGEKAIPILTSYLESTTKIPYRVDALQALGKIATQSNAPVLFTHFIHLLETDDPTIQTEAVQGLGNLGDRRAIEPLKQLNLKAWSDPSTSPEMTALREMLTWSLWQLSPDAHTGW